MSRRVHENKLKKNLYRTNNTISKNARFLRIISGHTQQEMADLLGMCRAAYHSLESGGKQVDFKTLSILSEFYEIEMSYLVTFDICEQMMNMIKTDQEKIRATAFLERYLSLSRSSKEQVKAEIMGISEHEKLFRRFPWKYEGFEELITTDALYKKRLFYEERLKKDKDIWL